MKSFLLSISGNGKKFGKTFIIDCKKLQQHLKVQVEQLKIQSHKRKTDEKHEKIHGLSHVIPCFQLTQDTNTCIQILFAIVIRKVVRLLQKQFFLQIKTVKKPQSVPPFTFFGSVRLFPNYRFPSEIRFSQNISTTNFFNTIRIISELHCVLLKKEKKEAVVGKQGNPFIPARNFWLFRHFVSFSQKTSRTNIKLCAF